MLIGARKVLESSGRRAHNDGQRTLGLPTRPVQLGRQSPARSRARVVLGRRYFGCRDPRVVESGCFLNRY